MHKKKDAKKAEKKAEAARGGVKLPKAIGGVKLPKEIRKSGEALLAKANSPAGRQVIASGLTMAAAAATAAVARSRRTDTPTPKAPGDGGTIDPQQIADAVGQAADAVLARLFGAKRSG